MRKDLLPLRGVLLLAQEAPLLQALKLLQTRAGRRRRGGCRNRRRGLAGWGRLAPDVGSEALRRRDRREDQHPLLRRRFHDHGSVAEHPLHDPLSDFDVLDLLERRVLDLAREEADLPDYTT